MTKQEGINLLLEHCKKEQADTGWWIFFKEPFHFEETRLLESHQKKANLPLPQDLIINNITINSKGVKIRETTYNWEDICATAIKTKWVDINEEETRKDKYLLICLNNGQISDLLLGPIKHLYGLTGHFIEQYKAIHSARASV